MNQNHSRPQEPFDAVVARARGEFVEMPGLKLTAAQAKRLWALDSDVCTAVLGELLQSGFLMRTAGESFVRAHYD